MVLFVVMPLPFSPPPPITRDADSHLSASSLHHVYVHLEAHVGVVRSGGSLRMVLDAEGVFSSAEHTGTGSVVKVDVCDIHILR